MKKMKKPGIVLPLFAVLACLAPGGAPRAQTNTPAREIEAYSKEINQRVPQVREYGIDPSPEGKTIEKILVTSQDVFDPQDPWPVYFNRFHSTTRAETVRRELLFEEGEKWDPVLIDETSRLLRDNLFVSHAQIIPLKSKKPNQVVAMVVTKDLWSLRASTDFSYVGSDLERLELDLSEENLFGRRKRVGFNYKLNRGSYAFTQDYVDPRIQGSRLSGTESLGVILNRETQRAEGGTGVLSIGKPLYSLRTEWGWGASAQVQRNVVRLYSGGSLVGYRSSATGEVVPYAYRRKRVDLKARVTRSYGVNLKQNVSGGWLGVIKDYGLISGLPSVQEATLADFSANVIPRSEQAGILFLAYDLYEPHYAQIYDLETFALTEDIRLGPSVSLETRLARKYFGFSSDYFEPLLSVGWSWRIGDDFLSTAFSASARRQEDVYPGQTWVNRNASFSIRNASPEFSGVRLHSSMSFTRRAYDLTRSVESLGGDDGLRGYASGAFTGSQQVLANAELRSRPYRLWNIHWGWAAFYDTGDAFDQVSDLTLHSSVGAGLRILFPEFNRAVLRVDVAAPISTLPAGMAANYLSAAFGQAF